MKIYAKRLVYCYIYFYNLIKPILIEPFAMIFDYVRNMDFESKPDYDFIKRGIKSVYN